MKLNKIFSALVLAAATVACTQEKAIENPFIATEAANYELPADGGKLTVTFTSNMPWEMKVTPGNAQNVADIKVSPSYGEASKLPITVTVTAKANPETKRVAIVSIIGSGASAAFKVNQAGKNDPTDIKGTIATPYKASELYAAVKNGEQFTESVYVTGVISKLIDMSPSYGNATYMISDDGTEAEESFEIFRGKMFGGASYTEADASLLVVGATIMACGVPTIYNGTPEFKQGNVLISVNGKAPSAGEGTFENPFNVSKAIELVKADQASSDEVHVKGYISQIDKAFTSYGDAQYWISDDGTTLHQMEVYQGLGLNGANFTKEGEINLGDEVIIRGKLTAYKDIVEFAAKSQIVSINGKTE